MKKKINVVLVGYGHLGKWHAQKITSFDVNFHAIVEVDDSKHESLRETFPGVTITSSLDNVINEGHAFLVVTPTKYHKEIVIKLLQASKHVFCEKPLCLDVKETLEIEEFYKKEQVLQVGHSERFHEVWELIRPVIGSESYDLACTRKAKFKGRATDVSVIEDLMIHDVDLMLYFKKEMPVSVMAYGRKVVSNFYDEVVAVFKFADESHCKIEASRVFLDERRLFEVSLTNKKILVDLFKNTYSILNENEEKESSYTKRDHLLEEQKYFFSSCESGHPAIIGFEDAKKAIVLLDKIKESIEKSEQVKC